MRAGQGAPALAASPVPTGRLRLAVSAGPGGRAALGVYRPGTVRGRLLRAGVAAASRLPGGPDPRSGLLADLAGALDLPVDGACAMASAQAGRTIVGLTVAGRPAVVAKVSAGDDTALRHEAATLERLQGAAGLRVPRLLAAGPLGAGFFCATGWVPGRLRLDDATVLRVALALAERDWTHGDFAPWNLAGFPVTLLDWERARPGLVPLSDLAHFVLRREALLGRGRPAAVTGALCGPAGLGAAYLTALGVDPREAPALLRAHLDRAGAARGGAAERALSRGVRALLR